MANFLKTKTKTKKNLVLQFHFKAMIAFLTEGHGWVPS